jgi:hypothetical protein
MDEPKKETENLKTPEDKVSSGERAVSFKQEGEAKEIKEMSSNEKLVDAELRKEIELMELDENLKKEAAEKANKIHFLADDDKLKNLLQIAKEKGVIYAIKVAKAMNEPYLLDIFHDMLAKEGLYKQFIKE